MSPKFLQGTIVFKKHLLAIGVSWNDITVKGISNGVVKIKGTVSLRLFTDTHATANDFHVIGNGFQIQYDGILGRDFWEKGRQSLATVTMRS
jgi:hypothetical protein